MLSFALRTFLNTQVTSAEVSATFLLYWEKTVLGINMELNTKYVFSYLILDLASEKTQSLSLRGLGTDMKPCKTLDEQAATPSV